jgi:hypothetical protein
LVLSVTFTPTAIATLRRHQNAGAIFVLNLFLGWTFLGWVAALAWSSTAVQPEQVTQPVANPDQVWDRTAIYGVEPEQPAPVASKLGNFTSSFKD